MRVIGETGCVLSSTSVCVKVAAVVLALLLMAGDVERNPGPETKEELRDGVPQARLDSADSAMWVSDSDGRIPSSFEQSSQSSKSGSAPSQTNINNFFKPKSGRLPAPGPPPRGDGSNLRPKKQKKPKKPSRQKSARKVRNPAAIQDTQNTSTAGEQGQQPAGTQDSIVMQEATASTSEATNMSQDEQKQVRKRPCGKCEPCQREDCGDCKHCKDKSKFGGENKLRQRCLKRTCLNPVFAQVKRSTSAGTNRIFEKAMKEGYVTIYATKCAITGPPGSGKSNLRSLILDDERPAIRQSTPVATEATQATPDCVPSIQEDMVIAGQNDGKWKIVDSDQMKQLVASWVKKPKYEMDGEGDVQAKTTSTNSGEDVETAEEFSHKPTIPVNLRISREILRLLRKSHHRADCLHEMRFVYLVDTGGQPQFQEVLPMFVRNASVNLFVFKLSEKLSDCPNFTYYIGGNQYCEPKELHLTNKEIIEYAARSVFSCSQTREIEHVRQMPTQPAVVLVGTFKDQSDTCETLESKQEILLKVLEPYINQDGIIGASRKMMIFDIDGSEEGWSRNDSILTKLRYEVIIRSESMKIDVPIRWFMFQLELKDYAKQKNLDFVTLKVCYEIGEHLQMDKADIDQVLLFLDEVNIILYYPDILHDVVFCNPQFLLRKVTEIIVASFKCLDVLPGDKFGSCKTFEKEGIFSSQLISAAAFQAGYNENFSQNDLLFLLKKLLIIAKVGEDSYFMPCVLPIEQPTSDARHQLRAESDFAPLVFSFPRGYSPRGLFCALIVYLTSQSRPHTWNIKPKQDLARKRNSIEFNIQTTTSESVPFRSTKSMGTVVIEDTLSLFVVYVFGFGVDYCQEIRRTVCTAMLHATENLYYDHSKIDCEIGFFCDGSCGIKPEHAAAAQMDGKVKCTKNLRKKAKPFTEEQQPWFDLSTSSLQTKDNDNAAEPSLCQLMDDVAALVSVSWKNIAVQLDLSAAEIGRIEQKEGGNVFDCFREVFILWERKNTRPYTWATMIAALKSGCVGENRIANKLEMKYYNVSNQSAECRLGKHPRDDSDISTDLPQKQLRKS